MKKRTRKSSFIPRQSEEAPGADVVIKTKEDGGVVVSFSDGSNDMNVSRRDFMRISGVAAASAALAGSACRNPVEKIVPYVDRPEEVRIGLPNYYATVWENTGVLVQTRAGRPVKVEGNPKHPTSMGGLSARGLSSYMRLYDPDRAKTPLLIKGDSSTKRTWKELDNEVVNKLKASASGGIRILTNTLSGSAQRALIEEITKALPNVKHYTYEALSNEAMLEANEISYGKRGLPHYRFDRADMVVSFQSDFLGTWFSSVEFAKQFSTRRNPEGNMSRFVAFEGMLTTTGANADERHQVLPSHLPAIAMALAHEVAIVNKKSKISTGAVAGALAAFSSDKVAKLTGLDAKVFKTLGKQLAQKVGKSLIVSGGFTSSASYGVSLEAAVNLLNAILGADGNTIERDLTSLQSQGEFGQLKQLIDEINAGKVSVLIIANANPAYSAPLELGLEKALTGANKPFIVSCSDRIDETSKFANYLAAGSNYLESWGDSVPFEGVYSIVQPVISPLYDTRPFEESLLRWFISSGALKAPKYDAMLKDPKKPAGNYPGGAVFSAGAWYRFVRDHWKTVIYPKANAATSFVNFWEAALRTGIWRSPESRQKAPTFNAGKTLAALPKALPKAQARKAGDLSNKEVVLFPTVALFDGADANNGKLLELPDPITRMTWNSYVMVSPKTFREANLQNGEVLKIKRLGGERSLEFPVIMVPGMHDDVVAIPVGFGRTRAGVVANGIGQNAFLLSTTDTKSKKPLHHLGGFAVQMDKTSNSVDLAIAQGSQVIDLHKRGNMSMTTYKEYKKDHSAGIHTHPPLPDLWKDHDYGNLKWGMAVDLSKCTGCAACVIACQEENNTPVVGAEGIREGREMSWMRIDRYYRLPDNKELNDRRHKFYGGIIGSKSGDPMLDKEPYVSMSKWLEKPRVVFQPMMCQHCESAPCETVCPVLATMHSSDGINQMAYNRCVGTRYCANNCPFKVRRFNWYNYSEGRGDTVFARLYPHLKDLDNYNNREPLSMAYNPEVTVRSRGVMEKCNFCVHRIRRAKWQAKREGRSKMRDGDVSVACQQACPSEAIVFGNLLDPTSDVAKMHAKQRALSPLSELGIESSVAYMTRVVNNDILDALDNAPKKHGHGHKKDHGKDHSKDHSKAGKKAKGDKKH